MAALAPAHGAGTDARRRLRQRRLQHLRGPGGKPGPGHVLLRARARRRTPPHRAARTRRRGVRGARPARDRASAEPSSGASTRSSAWRRSSTSATTAACSSRWPRCCGPGGRLLLTTPYEQHRPLYTRGAPPEPGRGRLPRALRLLARAPRRAGTRGRPAAAAAGLRQRPGLPASDEPDAAPHATPRAHARVGPDAAAALAGGARPPPDATAALPLPVGSGRGHPAARTSR